MYSRIYYNEEVLAQLFTDSAVEIISNVSSAVSSELRYGDPRVFEVSTSLVELHVVRKQKVWGPQE